MMFKNSSKTKLDFDSGFKPLKVIPDGPSSKKIINLNLIFESDTVLNEVFLEQKYFALNLFPKQGFYNFITTNKSISTLEFLDLFLEHELTEIILFITKMDKKNKVLFIKYAAKTILFTNDEISDVNAKKTIICATHAKAVLFQIKENFYSIIGSGNPSYNSAREQYLIFNNYDIFKKIQDICL